MSQWVGGLAAKVGVEDKEAAPWLRALAALLEDLSSVASTHRRKLTTAYDSSNRRSSTFGLYGHLYSGVYTHIQTHTYAKFKIINNNLFKRYNLVYIYKPSTVGMETRESLGLTGCHMLQVVT